MLASHKWLMELSGLDLSPDEVARRFTGAGLEVESTRELGNALDRVVVAEVRAKKPHPSRDKLSLVTLFDGTAEQEVVCGASNVPEAGGLVAFAQLGATLPGGLLIEERKLGGVVSRGMICSESELEIGSEDDGILILEPGEGVRPGVQLTQALGLRDTVYEIGLTPNRADCLGHVGLARELCALVGRPFAWPKLPVAARLDAREPRAGNAHEFSLLDHGVTAVDPAPAANEPATPEVSVRLEAP